MNGVNLLRAHQFLVKNIVNHHSIRTYKSEPIDPSETPVSAMLGHEQACCVCDYDNVLPAAERTDHSRQPQVIHKNSPNSYEKLCKHVDWQPYLEAII